MTIAAPPPGLQPEDYEEIEAAVMETARGRWFLSEYARRLRAADADRLMAAIERLERRLLLVTRDGASLAPEAAARLAERLQDFAWTLRERGLDEHICAEIEEFAREASAANVVGERPAPREAEQAPNPERIAIGEPEGPRSIEAVTDREPSGSQRLDHRPDVGRTLLLEPPPEPAGAIEPPPKPETADPRLVALSRLDRLPLAEKFALFG